MKEILTETECELVKCSIMELMDSLDDIAERMYIRDWTVGTKVMLLLRLSIANLIINHSDSPENAEVNFAKFVKYLGENAKFMIQQHFEEEEPKKKKAKK